MPTGCNSMRAVALGLSTALLSLAIAEIQPAQASEVFAFQCLKAGDQAVIALGNMPKPVGGVAMNPATLQPLEGSGMFPFAFVRSKVGGVNITGSGAVFAPGYGRAPGGLTIRF